MNHIFLFFHNLVFAFTINKAILVKLLKIVVSFESRSSYYNMYILNLDILFVFVFAFAFT